ncbi:transmembrane protein 19 [Nannochloropsis gaditana]|uniref:Transmembrane protein 19 n=1 Tax=Nannochloropsis gaditana TaxID=72520 RepID=W7TJF0_9STRA|nr:transmembrane protein 19 [Nannochloropsis gaditana]
MRSGVPGPRRRLSYARQTVTAPGFQALRVYVAGKALRNKISDRSDRGASGFEEMLSFDFVEVFAQTAQLFHIHTQRENMSLPDKLPPLPVSEASRPPSKFLINLVMATIFATTLSYRGLWKHSLSKSGALAAWVVGFLSMGASLRFGALMILFYQSSSMLTRYRCETKALLEEDHKQGGQRSAAQVLACSFLGTLIAVAFVFLLGPDDLPLNFEASPLRSRLLCAYVGHYACCNGDTWASEIGILSPSSPRLVTAGFRRVVPRGTNGGMSLTGTLASIAGGALIGTGHSILGFVLGMPDDASGAGWCPGWFFMTVIGAACGFIGSLSDSILGGLFQATWYCAEKKRVVKHPTAQERQGRGAEQVRLISGLDLLSNEHVNLISIALSTALAPVLGRLLW